MPDMPALEKLGKWRSVLVGWMLGTRAAASPGVQGYRDLIDRTLVLRVEVDALAQLLIRAGVITSAEFAAAIEESALHYDRLFEKKFPGYSTNATGVVIDPRAVETNARLGFPQ